MLWTSTLALAAPLATPADVPVVDPVKYLVACMGVLGLLAAGLFALRKLVVGAQRTRAAGRSLAVLDQLHLGGSKRLAVVRCYDRQFVLGVGDKEISMVAELDVDQAVPPLPERAPASEQPAPQGNEQPAAREAFQGLLQRAQKLADAIVPPRRANSADAELPVATVQPKRAAESAGAARAGEPSPEVKAKVARELLAKLGPEHELLGAVRAAADVERPQAARPGQRARKARAGQARTENAAKGAPGRRAAGQGRVQSQPQGQANRPARASEPTADEGWLG